MWWESVCTKFQVCIVFRLARERETGTHPHTYTSENRDFLPPASLPWILIIIWTQVKASTHLLLTYGTVVGR